MKKLVDTRYWEVMPKRCGSCPFNDNGDQQTRGMVEKRCINSASQICHHPRLKGGKQTHLCRGARDFQLKIFFRMGFISAPTDEAWNAKRKELGV